MSEKLIKLNIQREKGYLYFIDKDGDVSKAKIGRKKKVETDGTNIQDTP